MGDADQTGIERRNRLFVARLAMPSADQHARVDEALDRGDRHPLGRDGQHDLATARAGQDGDHLLVQIAEARRVVDTFPRRIQHRPFDMDADDAGHLRLDRLVDRIERAGDLVGRLADQSRQHRGGAIGRMRRRHGRDAVDVETVVEQHAAAAIDLRIDIAGHDPAAVQVDRVRRTLHRADRRDTIAVHDDLRAWQNPVLGRDMAVDETETGHSVRVTFCRCGGESGSMPRASASASTMR